MLFANVCARFIRSCYGEFWVWDFLGFHVSLWCLVHSGGSGFAGLPPVVYRAWVKLVCLLLDSPFGRCPVGALPS